MSLTGSIVVYVIIWWIVFISFLPVGIKHDNRKFTEGIRGADPGSPKNPNIGKKFIYTTILTSVLFIGIYYMVNNEFLNLRSFFN